MTTFEPRQTAWQIMQAALQAVDPKIAVEHFFNHHSDVLAEILTSPGRLLVVGAGKASAPMAVAISEIFGNKVTAGQIIVKYGHTHPLPSDSPIKLVEAAHPVPDATGLQATTEMVELLKSATADDIVLCLISGGGSALLTLPAAGLSLNDLQATNKTLLAAGATINQMNTLRKHLSAVKGGRLAQLAAPAKIYALILSDVVGDPLDVIASGPTVPDPTTFEDAWSIVEQYQLENNLPPAVIDHLRAGRAKTVSETPKPYESLFAKVHNTIIGSNRLAAQAAVDAAQAAGLDSLLLTTFIEGEAREVGRVLAGIAKGIVRDEGPLKRPACVILGGETTVTIRGKGKGGRNQEMALAAAIALAGWSHCLVACLGTDGNDGPTDAAGAWADGSTVGRAQAMGLEAVHYLERNDAYNFFKHLNELIVTGPTNTNVNDLMLILAW